MRTSKRIKWVVVSLGGLVLLLILLLAAMPLWFPWVARPILRGYGLEYSDYQREGYSRFALTDLKYQEDETIFEAERAELFVPVVWLWRRYLGPVDEPEGYLAVENWRYQMAADEEPDRPKPSTYEALQRAEGLLARLEWWLPSARFENGWIESGDQELRVQEMLWKDGVLDARSIHEAVDGPLLLQADVSEGLPYQLTLDAPDLGIRSAHEMVQTGGALTLDGAVLWGTNRFELGARFGTDARFPDSAIVRAEAFRIPAEHFELEGYEDLTGALVAQWRQGRFEIDLRAHAEPEEQNSAFTPVHLRIEAEGNTNRVLVEALTITSPWLEASLSESVQIGFQGPWLTNRAVLNLSADLDKQPWVNAHGEVTGRAVLLPSTNRLPDIEFEMAGADVGRDQYTVEQLQVAGLLTWPWLRIESLTAEVPDAARVELGGSWHLQANHVSNAVLRVSGQLSSNVVPSGVQLQGVDAKVNFSGPITNLNHNGEVALRGLKLKSTKHLVVQADWEGELFELGKIQARVMARDSVLRLSGAASWLTNRTWLRIDEFELMSGDRRMLALSQPFETVLDRAPEPDAVDWLVALEPFSWRSGGRGLLVSGRAAWPESGQMHAEMTGIQSMYFDDFLAPPPPNVEIEQLQFSGGWTNQPVAFSLAAAARYRPEDGASYAMRVDAEGGPAGLRIRDLSVLTDQSPVLRAEGLLPVTIEPGGGDRLVVLHTNRPIEFRASTEPHGLFWDRIGKWAEIGLEEPRIQLQLSGTLESPRGTMSVSAAQVRLDRFEQARDLPPLNDVQAQVEIHPEAIEIQRLIFSMEGQMVETTARIPLNTNVTDWRKLIPSQPVSFRRQHGGEAVLLALNSPALPPWLVGVLQADSAPEENEVSREKEGGFTLSRLLKLGQLTGRIRIQDAAMSAFAPMFPELFSPQGRVDLDLEVLPGQNLRGHLTITGAATRPIMPLGAVDEIDARLKFEGKRIEVERMTGVLGGQTVSVSGWVDLEERTDGNGLPRFQVQVRGRNVPLVRTPGLILRSDLDIAVANVTNAVPTVSGLMELRQSFFLSDLRDLIPGGVASPEQRPPYFSVEAEPLSSWRLDLRVRGDDFLHVRSPLFRGLVSATMKMEGTLAEPMALGEVTVDAGTIQFPFANLAVRQGIVSLTSDQPYQPNLFVIAGDRVFGYDLQIEVQGTAAKPVIEFSSTPPLSSEEIVLMLTAGQLPRKGPTLGDQQRVARLGLFLGKGLLSKFGATEATAERLTIRTGENISDQGKETYSAEYRLTDRWSIVGEYDQFNDFNLGFRWRIYSR